MAANVAGQGKDLGPEDFEAIREAVMETPRGRWFLAEFTERLRNSETATMLDSMKRLETAVSTNHDQLMLRLAEALTREPGPAAAAQRPQADLAPKHMKYFRQDEEIFEPAPQARISAVPEPAKPAIQKGARLIIHRTGEPPAADADGGQANAEESAPAPVAIPSHPFISAPEPLIPPVDAAPAKPVEASEAEAAPKRRIVIIRHKPGEDIDVPMQNDMAAAS